MKQSNSESFPEEVARQLKTYVYRLIDPRNGETFYVGKGWAIAQAAAIPQKACGTYANR